jgi:phospholipid transport system transporter-binding protein
MLAQGLRSQPVAVVADAGALAHFDSSALAVLLECRREALAGGKTFAVARLPARLRELAVLYGVAELLPAAS